MVQASKWHFKTRPCLSVQARVLKYILSHKNTQVDGRWEEVRLRRQVSRTGRWGKTREAPQSACSKHTVGLPIPGWEVERDSQYGLEVSAELVGSKRNEQSEQLSAVLLQLQTK